MFFELLILSFVNERLGLFKNLKDPFFLPQFTRAFIVADADICIILFIRLRVSLMICNGRGVGVGVGA